MPFDRISKYDSAVFDRMMAVDLKISITFDMQIEETVLGKSLQHMIKNPMPVSIWEIPLPSRFKVT